MVFDATSTCFAESECHYSIGLIFASFVQSTVDSNEPSAATPWQPPLPIADSSARQVIPPIDSATALHPRAR